MTREEKSARVRRPDQAGYFRGRPVTLSPPRNPGKDDIQGLGEVEHQHPCMLARYPQYPGCIVRRLMRPGDVDIDVRSVLVSHRKR